MKLLEDIYYSIVNFFKFIARVWAYLPILRRDRDWDYYHLLALTDFKLNRMLREFELDNNVAPEYTNRKIKQVKYARLLLKRIKDEYNEEQLEAAHDAKWGELKTSFEDVPDKGYSKMLFARPNANTPEEKELEREESLKKWYTIVDLNKKLELRLAKFLIRHYRGWWT